MLDVVDVITLEKCVLHSAEPKFIDPVFAKTGSINSGTGQR
jgi:hypothetical protein